MRVLKDDIYQAILKSARNEFIRKGFKDTSMRDIAKNAHVSLSNIYNYFKNKDEIFLAIVKPAKDNIFRFVEQQHTEENIDFNKMSTFHYQEETTEVYIQLLMKYKDELRLLLYHSEGSSMKNFRETFTEYLTQVSLKHMDIIKKHYPKVRHISPFFIHALCAFMVSTVGEIVIHNLSRQKIREFFGEYFKFEIAGWRELTGL
ncbi:MAG: TetR/AcrR family transcriptional regulator [Bacteroidales bacterium]|jgi:AcrR family transcriptional regulator|nr:TetR/AcrR family transcriptional regulator [Bacteroidales bacterium]